MASTGYLRQKSQSLNLVDRIAKRELALSAAAPNASPKLWARAYIDDTLGHSTQFYFKDLLAHYGCVNCVEFSPDGVLLASGSDDKRVLIWDIWNAIHKAKYVPLEMKSLHNSNIFCLSFDSVQKRVFSAGMDAVVILHNIETREAIDVISHMDDVYGLSVDPLNNNVFASASNEIMLWDIRTPNAKSTQLATGSAPFHAVMHNPCDSNILVTANSKDGIAVYDSRKPMHKLLHFYSTSIMNSQSAMCVRFNRYGNKILALRRRLSPVLYDIRSPYPVVEFDSEDYYNSCTLKSCCFAGEDDQFVVSGSDNFKVFMWRIPDEVLSDSSNKSPLKLNSVLHVPQANQILNGHRSIVNQVRFNEQNGMIASAGVEKVIKLWSPIVHFEEQQKVNSREINLESPVRRTVFTYHDYLNLVHNDRFYVPHDYSSNNIAEDRRMIAYFDSMIQRDISETTWLSSSEDESPSYFNYIMKHELDYTDHLKSFKLDSEETNELSFRDISTDSDEKLAILKRFDFSKSFEPNKLDEDDYLAYVFAKRMHARYLTSFVNNLIGQIEKLSCDKEGNTGEDLPKPQASEEQSSRMDASSRDSDQSSSASSESLDSSNINQKIKAKKENALIFFAYKFSKALLLSFHFGTLYDMSKNKLFQEYFNESKELNNSKSKIYAQIKTMSKLKGAKNLCDKRLNSILNALYKRVLHLLNLLNDSHYDIKARCEDFIRNMKPRTFQRHFLATFVDDETDDSDSDSELEIEDEHEEEDIVMETFMEADSEEADSMASLSSSSSSSPTSSSSSSSSMSSDMSEDEAEKTKTEKDSTSTEVDLSNLNCDHQAGTQVLCTNFTTTTTTHSEMKPSTSKTTNQAEEQSTSSKGIFFKKIDRTNKSYKQQLQRKKHRKVCKNKRQRKS